ncbi:MAG: response regulator, partial [Methanomicrobiales archaeon]|nr:response regulator [Methanomicrobiales archaeon]
MIRILYVDDEDLLLDLAKIFLEKSGEFSVDISTTAVGLADSSRISSYEAIISDYQMPDMNGIEFLKEIRKRYPDLPFILFTGRGREEVVIEAINNGADFYLQKGGDPKAQFAELNHKVLQAVKRRRTERELYNSENNAREILETLRKTQSVAHVGNWVLDLKTNRYTASDEALQLIGLSPGISPTFEDIANIIHPEDRPRIRDLFVHSLTTGESYSTEMRIILPTTGEMRYLATFGEIKQDKNGKPVQVFGVNQDITELKNTSCALAEHETQFRQIIDNLPISISIVTLDGKILYANPEAVKLF